MNKLQDTLHERRLLRAIIVKKDAQAYGEMYDKYADKMYRFILFKVSDTESAQDITSEVFMSVWNYLTVGKQKSEESISGLFYRTARNKIIDLYRERARTQQQSLDILDRDVGPAHTRQMDKVETDDEVRRLLEDMRRLKAEYQEVLMLRYIEELSIDEIAVILEKKKTHVRVLIHRSVKKLQQIHNQKYG